MGFEKKLAIFKHLQVYCFILWLASTAFFLIDSFSYQISIALMKFKATSSEFPSILLLFPKHIAFSWGVWGIPLLIFFVSPIRNQKILKSFFFCQIFIAFIFSLHVFARLMPLSAKIENSVEKISPTIAIPENKTSFQHPKIDPTQKRFLRMSVPTLGAPLLTGGHWERNALEEKVYIVDFWASWCQPCIKSIPRIFEIQKEFKDRSDLEFIMVSLDKNNEAARKFINEKKLPGVQVWTAGQGFDHPLPRGFRVDRIPHTEIISKGNTSQTIDLRDENAIREIWEVLNTTKADYEAKETHPK